MIQSQTPNCVGLVTLKSQLTCVYDPLTRLLKVTNAAPVDLTSETAVSFTVDNFQNPYNGIEKSGFQITTRENTGTGQIDQSDILSIIVTQFTLLESPTVTRADLITTVGEFSSLKFSFSLNLPVDPDCRIRVIFPSDQPVTMDLTSSSGTNLFASAFGLTAFSL